MFLRLLFNFIFGSIPLWSTKNGRIFYKNKIEYTIRGCNWHGIETNCKVPHGLWINSIDTYFNLLSKNDFNSIRVPMSYEVMKNFDSIIVSEDCVIANPQYINKTVEIFMDDFFKKAQENDITILIDLHTLEGRITEYPWTSQISYNDTINVWTNFIKRYENKIFGIELKHEPHNQCSFDIFSEWCKSAIIEIEKNTNYKGLYFVSGVQYAFNNGEFNRTWNGIMGDGQEIEFATYKLEDLVNNTYLLEPKIPQNRIVFCPHVTSPSILGNIINTNSWSNGFAYINNKNWIWKDNAIIFTQIGGWFEGGQINFYYNFRDWCIKYNFQQGMYWWTLPPTSMLEGGLLLGQSWLQVDSYKLNYIKSFIPEPTVGNLDSKIRYIRN
jgi:aryl-phospho-beta-D-glucosidase BglC (GH1 family)